jgi:hypothetical protein
LHAARRTEQTVLPQEESANYIRPAFKKQNFWLAEKQLDAARRVG